MIGQVVDKQIKTKLSESPETVVNPFPGLRPFSFQESYLFYGQDQISDQIIRKLLDNKFVCLLGGAGVGKTSVINCGIQPLVLSGLLNGPETRWHFFRTQPGLNPVRNLANVIYTSKFKECFEEDQRIQEQICQSILRRGRQGLIELISQFQLAGDHKFLFIIDQFEDLFRLRNYSNEIEFYEEALQYVNLFVEALNSSRYQVYVVLSIRSDFTDDCVMFPVLAEYINKSNVLIPKMNRLQVRETVLSPLRAMNVKIDDSAIIQILNDSATLDDMLPRLQHTMRRTWESWASLNNWDKPITSKEYESVGGIKNSISNHADSLYDELNEADQELCEIIFKSLTERGSENKGLSRHVMISELAQIAKTDVGDVIRVVNVFSQPKVGFLTYEGQELQPSTIIDLSHVSLMRAWTRLKEWVEDEAISGQMYRQLSQASAAYQVGRTNLLQPPDLQFAINWKEKQKPTLQWAKRYNPAFERTMVYLRTSLEKYETDEAFKKHKARQAFRRVRSFSIVLGSTALLALALTIYSQILKRNAEKLTRIAVKQSYEDVAKSVKLEKISKEALEEKGKAELAANEAERLRQQALEQSKELSEQKTLAETTAEQAIKRSVETEQSLVQVSKQKEQAEQSALQISIQKTQAEKEKDEAFKKRMLIIAQTIATKSEQMQGNKNLKSCLALHAYEFNKSYGGFDNSPDIYYALSSALDDQGLSMRNGFKGHSASVKTLVVSPKGNILYSTGSDGRVFAWNLNEADPSPNTILKNTLGNLCLAISPNGRLLAVGSDNGIIQVVDLSYPDLAPVQLKGHQGTVYDVAFSRDGQQLYSAGSDKTLFLWDLSSRTSTQFFKESTSVRVISLSPDGHFLAGGTDDGRLLLWETKSGQMSVLSSEGSNPIYSLAFNNSGTILVSGDVKGGIKLWNPYSHKQILSFKNHKARVVDIAFSPAGDLMASSSYDGSVFIYDTRNMSNMPIQIREPSSWVLSVAFSGDGKRILLATNKPDFLISYPTQSKYMVGQLCSKISRGLTTDEWNTYIGNDIKYEKPCE
jgi:WD40 repeat protein